MNIIEEIINNKTNTSLIYGIIDDLIGTIEDKNRHEWLYEEKNEELFSKALETAIEEEYKKIENEVSFYIFRIFILESIKPNYDEEIQAVSEIFEKVERTL